MTGLIVFGVMCVVVPLLCGLGESWKDRNKS